MTTESPDRFRVLGEMEIVALALEAETKKETKRRRRKKEKLMIMATEESKNNCCRSAGDEDINTVINTAAFSSFAVSD